MDCEKQDHCLLGQHLVVMDYHLYDPIQLIVAEHSGKQEILIQKILKIQHIQELEVEYVVQVDFHLKQ
jgi:hypothetical protein